MSAAAEAAFAPPRWPFLRFLRDELTLEPGRWERMVRITAIVSLVTVVSNALRVPELAISAFVIFSVSGADVATTVRTALGGIFAMTLAIVFALVLFTFTAAEPLLRLAVMACSIFVFFYFMKISRLGPVAFLVGFLSAYVMTLFDRVPSPEVLVRGALWIWVALVYPIAALVILDVVFGRRAEQVFRDGIAERLEAAAAFLAAAGSDESAERRRIEHLEREGTAKFSK
jgi:multidrug resistance protein MdtO